MRKRTTNDEGNDVPVRFQYFVEVARRYGIDGLLIPSELERFANGLDPVQICDLAKVYESVRRRGDQFEISRWIDSCSPGDRREGLAARAFRLFVLFDELARRQMSPSASGEVQYIPEPRRKLEWSKLPREFHYLVSAAEQYGVYESDDSRLKLSESITDAAVQRLRTLASRVRGRGDYKKLGAWWRTFPITKHREASLLYFLFGVMDQLDLKFD